MRILLVEDDIIIADGLVAALKQSGLDADWAKSREEGTFAIETNHYGAMILDLGLPDGSGLDLLKKIRITKNTIPVLILTAHDTLNDKVGGLNAGADDYLVKPFELEELIARVRALLRRSQQRSESHIVHGELILDPSGHTVTFNGENVELSHRELALLEYLLVNRGRVLSRAQLEQCLYGWNSEIESNSVEVHIHHLRKKFGIDLIKTVRGIGYIIEKSNLGSGEK